MSIRDTLWELKKSLPFFKQKELMKKMQLLEERLEILHYMILTAADHNMKDQQIVCEISLAEHCNLNCYGCDHFAPLAKPEFADLEESRRDLTRLAELFGHRITEFYLAGGEPLLHPEITKFMEAARQAFPNSKIGIVTNGILLPKQPEEFWLACKKYNIALQPTKYPIDVDYEAMGERAQQYGVSYCCWGSTNKAQKTSTYFPLNTQGFHRGSWNFTACLLAGHNLSLEHGRLYTCSVAGKVRHFNEYFGKDLKMSPKDSIDIYAVKSEEEIDEYLMHPIPFCEYCTHWHIDLGMPWHRAMPWQQSRREIREWTL